MTHSSEDVSPTIQNTEHVSESADIDSPSTPHSSELETEINGIWQEIGAELSERFNSGQGSLDFLPYTDKVKALIACERQKAVYELHDSIMRGELPLGSETDQAFNYARIHRWIDRQSATNSNKGEAE